MDYPYYNAHGSLQSTEGLIVIKALITDRDSADFNYCCGHGAVSWASHVSSALCEAQHCQEKKLGCFWCFWLNPQSAESQLCCIVVVWSQAPFAENYQFLQNITTFESGIQSTRSEWTLSSLKIQNSLFQDFTCFLCRQKCCFSECDLIVLRFTRSSTGTMTTPTQPCLWISISASSARAIFYNFQFFFVLLGFF